MKLLPLTLISPKIQASEIFPALELIMSHQAISETITEIPSSLIDANNSSNLCGSKYLRGWDGGNIFAYNTCYASVQHYIHLTGIQIVNSAPLQG